MIKDEKISPRRLMKQQQRANKKRTPSEARRKKYKRRRREKDAASERALTYFESSFRRRPASDSTDRRGTRFRGSRYIAPSDCRRCRQSSGSRRLQEDERLDNRRLASNNTRRKTYYTGKLKIIRAYALL